MSREELPALAVTTEIGSPGNRLRLAQKSIIRVRLSVPGFSGDVSGNGSRVSNGECNASARSLRPSVRRIGGVVSVGGGVGIGGGGAVWVGVGAGVCGGGARGRAAREDRKPAWTSCGPEARRLF